MVFKWLTGKIIKWKNLLYKLPWESPGIQKRDNCDFEVLGFLLFSKIMKGFYLKKSLVESQAKKGKGKKFKHFKRKVSQIFFLQGLHS